LILCALMNLTISAPSIKLSISMLLTCTCLMAGSLLVNTWHQSVTRRDVRYVTKRDVRALHDVTSDMSQNVTSESYTTWRKICPTKDKISLHGSFTRMRILHRAYRNTITRIRFHASGCFSSSAIPLCACPVTCHSRYDNWTLIGRMRTTWPSNLNVTR
jgi:hypothetical protein